MRSPAPLIPLLFVLAQIPGCQKNDLPPPEDKIIYHSPEVSVNSVRHTVNDHLFHPECDRPEPLDSTASVTFGFSRDGEAFFKILSRTYTSTPQSPHQCPANYQITLSPADPANQIAFSADGPCLRFFNAGDEIDGSGLFFESSHLRNTYSAQLPFNCSFSGRTFVGFRIISGDKLLLGWIQIERTEHNGIRVIDLAANFTPGKSIICGQKT